MGTDHRSSLPIACQLSPDGQGERFAWLRGNLFSRVLSTVELEDGYAYQFSGEEDVLQQITEFVLSERQCCPFFTFELVFEPEHGPVTLTLRGPDGTKAFLAGFTAGD